MYPYSWQWSYTFIVLALLLAVFGIAGLVLLVRTRQRAQWHQTPDSIATPHGYLPIWDAATQEMAAPGVERARHRQYCDPRGE